MPGLAFDSNADQVAADLVGVVEAARRPADVEAADTALRLVVPKTPRRTGRLVAGLSAVAVPAGGFELVDPVPYATVVNARTGFATDTLTAAETTFADIYDRHLQTELTAI